MMVWWQQAHEDERQKVTALPTIQRLSASADLLHADYATSVRDVLLEALWASGSDLVVVPVQDVFGWRDRINEPAVIADRNWTFKLPWPSDRLDEIPEARERRDRMREWSVSYQRL